MMTTTALRVLDGARELVDEILHWLDTSDIAARSKAQLQESAESIPANIREGYGRDEGPDRSRFLRYARGSAEEADERLRIAFRAGKLPERDYWRWHHRLVTLSRMLSAILGPASGSRAKRK